MFINSTMAIYIESIPNRNSRPAILLRYAKRNGKRIERKTLANLSKNPCIHRRCHPYPFERRCHRQLPRPRHSPYTARCRTDMSRLWSLWLRKIGLPRILHRTGSRQRDLALAAIIARIISPALQTRYCQSAFARKPPTARWALYSSLIPYTAMKCSICLTGCEDGKCGSREASPIATCAAAR